MPNNDLAQGPLPSTRETEEERPDLAAGRYLREERIRQGISLAEVASATGIRTAILQAIEEDDRAHLPAAVFVRGLLKVYAEHLGLEPDGVLSRYGLQPSSGSASGADPDGDGPLPDILKLKRVAPKPLSFSPVHFLALVLFVGLLGYAGYLGFTSLSRQDSHALPVVLGGSEPPAAATTAPGPVESPALEVSAPAALEPSLRPETPPAALEPAPSPARDTSVPLSDGQISSPPPSLYEEGGVEEQADFPYLVTINFVEDVWLQVQIDDQPVQEGLFRKGASREWGGRDHLDFFFGNAGGAELILNNRPLPKLGASGETVRISIPRDFPG